MKNRIKYFTANMPSDLIFVWLLHSLLILGAVIVFIMVMPRFAPQDHSGEAAAGFSAITNVSEGPEAIKRNIFLYQVEAALRKGPAVKVSKPSGKVRILGTYRINGVVQVGQVLKALISDGKGDTSYASVGTTVGGYRVIHISRSMVTMVRTEDYQPDVQSLLADPGIDKFMIKK